jgi:hypothetical protein
MTENRFMIQSLRWHWAGTIVGGEWNMQLHKNHKISCHCSNNLQHWMISLWNGGSVNSQICHFLNLVYYSTVRNIWINDINLNEQVIRYSDSLGAGRSGDRISVGESFPLLPYRRCRPDSLLYKAYRMSPTNTAARAWCWPPTPLEPRLQKKYSFTSTLP